jgi:hypothetical protein
MSGVPVRKHLDVLIPRPDDSHMRLDIYLKAAWVGFMLTEDMAGVLT